MARNEYQATTETLTETENRLKIQFKPDIIYINYREFANRFFDFKTD